MADKEPQESALPAGARRDSGFFLLAFAITIVLYFLSIPLIYGVFVSAPAAAFFAGRALWRSRQVPKIASFRVGLIGGAVASGFALLTGVAMIVFHEPVTELQTCSARAITQTAADKCQRDYQKNLEELMEETFERFGVTTP